MPPSILTYKELDKFNLDLLNESKTIIKSSTYNQLNFDKGANSVFLSYSSKDSDKIPFIIKVLRKHGGLPYIDKGDNRLPETPSVKTARILKDAIINCKRLVVFVTTNSKDSKWIPWELGIGDGAKTNLDVALFPAAEKAYDTKWIEQEYLGLYRRITWGELEGYEEKLWMVYDHINNKAVRLVDWLKK